jgi:hypothetical protein
MESQPRFEVGTISASKRCLKILQANGIDALAFVDLHQRGDWGEVPTYQVAHNDDAVWRGGIIVSTYHIKTVEIWIVTEADRKQTRILLGDEY